MSASAGGETFNADFYAVAATVVPVLWLTAGLATAAITSVIQALQRLDRTVEYLDEVADAAFKNMIRRRWLAALYRLVGVAERPETDERPNLAPAFLEIYIVCGLVALICSLVALYLRSTATILQLVTLVSSLIVTLQSALILSVALLTVLQGMKAGRSNQPGQ